MNLGFSFAPGADGFPATSERLSYGQPTKSPVVADRLPQ